MSQSAVAKQALRDVPEWDSLWVNAHLATMEGEGYGVIRDGALAVRHGRIAWVGPRQSLPATG